jgi:hypothetical protein
MNIIFQINGGLGKSIIATAVCENIKKQYPDDKLIVVTAYPEVFLNNPNVDRCLQMGTVSYFYADFVKDQDVKLMLQEPYLETQHVKGNEHLVETWCKMNGIICETTKPSLFFTKREIDFHSRKYTFDKPIMVIQTNGGAVEQEQKYSWARDLPTYVVENIIKKFKNKYQIIHIRREDQIGYTDTIPVHDNFRSICVGLMISSKRLLIDSFVQHAAAALNLSSTVCWIVNSPEVFGYETHTNILANPYTRSYDFRQAYIQPFNIMGDVLEFPYNNETEIFNSDSIIESLN